MASEDRPASGDLASRLRDAPYGFDFFHLLRLLECAHPELPRIGHSQRLAEDQVRFGQEPSLAFAPATISGYEDARPPPGGGAGGFPPRVLLAFVGLLGPNGPMPHHVTEYARDRARNASDPTFARFLDIFNHRAVSLFYRAWAAANKSVNFEREGGDRFRVFIASLFGMGMESLQNRDSLPATATHFYAGHLSCQTRHADGLAGIVQDFFGIRTSIEQFAGQWMPLPSDCLCRLGRSRSTGLLGSTAIVGSRIWECQQRFRIRLGPMRLRQYEALLPGGPSLRRLADWVGQYTGLELDWDVQLVLLKDEVPQVALGRAGRLGWTTWVRSGPLPRDADDLILDPHVN